MAFLTKNPNFKLFSTNFWSPKNLGMAPDPKNSLILDQHTQRTKNSSKIRYSVRPRISLEPFEREGQ